MKSIKFLTIDIIISAIIIAAVLWDNRWLKYIVLVSTVSLLIFNVVGVVKLKFSRRRPIGEMNPNLHYLLYLFNGGVLWAYDWRLYAFLWGAIWLLALLIEWRLHLPKFKNILGSY